MAADLTSSKTRALAFVEAEAPEFEEWLAKTLVSGVPPQHCPLPEGVVQRDDGSFATPTSANDEIEWALLLRVVGALDDVRGLHLPVLERACAFLAVNQTEDGSWGELAMSEDDRIFVTGMLAGHFGKTRFARTSMLAAAADYLAERFSPERVQGFAWRAIASYAHVFANVPHDAGDAVLQWTGRELERGFRVGRFDAVSTARVMLYCDAPALPGAKLEAGELVERILVEQESDGGWLRLEDPSPEARLRHSLDALAALVRFG